VSIQAERDDALAEAERQRIEKQSAEDVSRQLAERVRYLEATVHNLERQHGIVAGQLIPPAGEVDLLMLIIMIIAVCW